MSWESQGVALLTASVVRPFWVGGGCVVDSSLPEGPAPGNDGTPFRRNTVHLRTASRRCSVRLSGPLRQIDGGMEPSAASRHRHRNIQSP
jgi:hypothetical protein